MPSSFFIRSNEAKTGQLDALVEDQEGLHAGVGEKQPVRQLRQARAILGHCWLRVLDRIGRGARRSRRGRDRRGKYRLRAARLAVAWYIRVALNSASRISYLSGATEGLPEKVQRKNRTLGTVAMLDAQTAKVDTRARILEVAESAVLAKGLRLDLDRGDHRGGRHHQERLLLSLPRQERARQGADAALPRARPAGARRHLRARRRTERRSAARLSGRPEAVRRDAGEHDRGASRAAWSRRSATRSNCSTARSASSTPTACWSGGGASSERLEVIAKRYPPRQETDFEALADMAATLVEGGLILGKVLRDADHFAAANSAIPGPRAFHLPSRVVNAGSGYRRRRGRPRDRAPGRACRP